jgi:hypothetical protein
MGRKPNILTWIIFFVLVLAIGIGCGLFNVWASWNPDKSTAVIIGASVCFVAAFGIWIWVTGIHHKRAAERLQARYGVYSDARERAEAERAAYITAYNEAVKDATGVGSGEGGVADQMLRAKMDRAYYAYLKTLTLEELKIRRPELLPERPFFTDDKQ